MKTILRTLGIGLATALALGPARAAEPIKIGFSQRPRMTTP